MPGYTLIEMAAREGAAEFIEAVSKIELTSDERVAFSRSPRAYLVERNVPNLTIQVGDAELGVYDLLESVDESARVAVSRTIAARVRSLPAKGAEVHPNFVIPLANAAILVNALMYVNANIIVNANLAANANVGANKNVTGHTNDPAVLAAQRRGRRLSLSTEYASSSLHAALGEKGYSDVRQAALIRSLIDEAEVVKRDLPGVQRFELHSHGLSIQVDIGIDEDATVVVLDARVISTEPSGEGTAR